MFLKRTIQSIKIDKVLGTSDGSHLTAVAASPLRFQFKSQKTDEILFSRRVYGIAHTACLYAFLWNQLSR